MSRRKENRRKGKKIFRQTAIKDKKLNVMVNVPRGGIRM